jgi:hypothetical protein
LSRFLFLDSCFSLMSNAERRVKNEEVGNHWAWQKPALRRQSFYSLFLLAFAGKCLIFSLWKRLLPLKCVCVLNFRLNKYIWSKRMYSAQKNFLTP